MSDFPLTRPAAGVYDPRETPAARVRRLQTEARALVMDAAEEVIEEMKRLVPMAEELADLQRAPDGIRTAMRDAARSMDLAIERYTAIRERIGV